MCGWQVSSKVFCIFLVCFIKVVVYFSVPQLKAVKTNCGHIITQYDQCLQANKNASDETLERECISSLKALYDCTDNVMNSFK